MSNYHRSQEDPHYVKRNFTWKHWQKAYGNDYITTPDIDQIWELLNNKASSREAIDYGVAVPGTLIGKGMSMCDFPNVIIIVFGRCQPPTFGTRRFSQCDNYCFRSLSATNFRYSTIFPILSKIPHASKPVVVSSGIIKKTVVPCGSGKIRPTFLGHFTTTTNLFHLWW